MRAQNQCLECIERLTKQAIDLSFSQKPTPINQANIIKNTIAIKLNEQFCTTKVPAAIFTKISRQIKQLTGIGNAFAKRKLQEMHSASVISSQVIKNTSSSLEDLLMFSAKGNSLDFFKTIKDSEKDMKKQSNFAINHIELFKEKLKTAKTIVFFADNAGEVFFDKPLVKFLTKTHRVYYVVKSSPVQNDLTINDLKLANHESFTPNIIASGNDAVGIELSTISKKLYTKLKESDIIIAKGMGHYETFTELHQFKEKIFYLLMTKCLPVANSLNVNLNSYVFSQS